MSPPIATTSSEIRAKLVEALKLHLVGPWPGHPFATELLPENPTRWYLTGYLEPESAPVAHRSDAEAKDEVDASVLTSYGWTDLLPKCTCEFLLDYEESEAGLANEGESSGRQKKKPWRCRWPDEVLACLLNAERAHEEKLAGMAAAAAAPAKTKKPRAKKSGAAPVQGDLLPDRQKDLFG